MTEQAQVTTENTVTQESQNTNVETNDVSAEAVASQDNSQQNASDNKISEKLAILARQERKHREQMAAREAAFVEKEKKYVEQEKDLAAWREYNKLKSNNPKLAALKLAGFNNFNEFAQWHLDNLDVADQEIPSPINSKLSELEEQVKAIAKAKEEENANYIKVQRELYDRNHLNIIKQHIGQETNLEKYPALNVAFEDGSKIYMEIKDIYLKQKAANGQPQSTNHEETIALLNRTEELLSQQIANQMALINRWQELKKPKQTDSKVTEATEEAKVVNKNQLKTDTNKPKTKTLTNNNVSDLTTSHKSVSTSEEERLAKIKARFGG